MKITLARALKIKNILAGKLPKVNSEIMVGNSVIVGTEQADIPVLVQKRRDIVDALLTLKTKINSSNEPIQRTIYELGELKSELGLYNGLNTRHGDSGSVHYGTTQKIEYRAVIQKAEQEKIVADLEAKIEEYQEKIDQHNYATQIEVSDKLLKTAGLQR